MDVGLGCVQLGSAAGGSGRRSSRRLVHAAVDLGVTYFDTADAYGAGTSEHVLGEALGSRRSAVQIATKGGYLFAERGLIARTARSGARAFGRRLRAAAPIGATRAGSGSAYTNQDFSVEYLTAALEASLRRLRTDHVDVYQLHGPRAGDPEAIAGWAANMVASGKIGRLGVGAEDLSQATNWLACPAVKSMQVPFGVLDPDAGAEVIPAANASGRAVVIRGVFGAGLLGDPQRADPSNPHKRPLINALCSLAADSGRTMAAMAVDFVRARPDVDTILVGTRSPVHLAEVVDTMSSPPPDPALLATIGETIAAHCWERRDC